MRHIQKLYAVAVCLLWMATTLCGCDATPDKAVEELNVYATFYPLYAIADMILDGVPDARLNCLVQPQDGCLRSYALSDWDFALLSRSADAIIAGGSGLESFESLLYSMGDSVPAVTEVLVNMELCTQAVVNAESNTAESHWKGGNPHIYMSVDGAIEIASRIAANLAVLDPQYEGRYMQNLETARNRLESLKIETSQRTGKLKNTRVAILNEALVYVAQDYEMEIALCYARESGESLTGKALEALIDQIGNSGAEVILIEKQAPRALLDALEGTGIPVAAMDTLSTRQAGEGAEGYFEAQRANATAICEALHANTEQ